MNRTTTEQSSKKSNGTSGTDTEMKDIAKEKLSMAATSASETAKEYGSHYVAEPAKDVFALLQDYAKSKPDIAAMWCFGIGVIVGWKLRR